MNHSRTSELAQILRNALADSDSRRPYMSAPRSAVQEVAALLERPLLAGQVSAQPSDETCDAIAARLNPNSGQSADWLRAQVREACGFPQPKVSGAAAPSPVAPVQAAQAESYEHRRAIMEAERNDSLRMWLTNRRLGDTGERLYERAFTNGWDRRAALSAPPIESKGVREVTLPSQIIDLLTAYGDARADDRAIVSGETLGIVIRELRAWAARLDAPITAVPAGEAEPVAWLTLSPRLPSGAQHFEVCDMEFAGSRTKANAFPVYRTAPAPGVVQSPADAALLTEAKELLPRLVNANTRWVETIGRSLAELLIGRITAALADSHPVQPASDAKGGA